MSLCFFGGGIWDWGISLVLSSFVVLYLEGGALRLCYLVSSWLTSV